MDDLRRRLPRILSEGTAEELSAALALIHTISENPNPKEDINNLIRVTTTSRDSRNELNSNRTEH
jgi:hypothetical protein